MYDMRIVLFLIMYNLRQSEEEYIFFFCKEKAHTKVNLHWKHLLVDYKFQQAEFLNFYLEQYQWSYYQALISELFYPALIYSSSLFCRPIVPNWHIICPKTAEPNNPQILRKKEKVKLSDRKPCILL